MENGAVSLRRVQDHGDPSAGSGQRPPHAQIGELLNSIRKVHALHAAVQLELADLLANGPRTSGELAQITDTHDRSLYRLLRALASFGVFTEVEPRCFALTELGAVLRSDAPGKIRARVLMACSALQTEPWRHLMHSLKTGESAEGKAFGMSRFEYMSAHPDLRALFDDSMLDLRIDAAAAVTGAYDFSDFQSIIDVGGGTGSLLAAILNSNLQARGTVFELADCVPKAQELIVNAGLSGRCDVLTGDFFEDVPSGYDAYILSQILHDWDDRKSAQILRNCRRAIGPEGKLLIVDAVLPPGDTPHIRKLLDFQFLVINGGMERTEEEFVELLSSQGFRLTRISPVTSANDIIEALPV